MYIHTYIYVCGILERDSTLESKRTILNISVGVALMELCSLSMIIVDLRVETCNLDQKLYICTQLRFSKIDHIITSLFISTQTWNQFDIDVVQNKYVLRNFCLQSQHDTVMCFSGGNFSSYCGLDESEVCCRAPRANVDSIRSLQTNCGKKGKDNGKIGTAEPTEWPWHV